MADVIHVSGATVGLAAHGEGLPRARALPDAERIFIRLKHVPGPVRAVAKTSAVAARYLSAGLSMSAPFPLPPAVDLLAQATLHVRAALMDPSKPTKARLRILWGAAKQARDLGSRMLCTTSSWRWRSKST